MPPSDNYTFSFVPGTLSIEKAPLVVAASDVSRVYGDANPTLTGAITGLKNGDNITAAFSSQANATSPVGTYPMLTVVQDPAGTLGNYNVTTSNGTLTVTPAALSVTAADASRPYGSANPKLTGSISGIKNSDNIVATFATAATVASPVGTYAIGVSLTDPSSKLGNYVVTSVGGTLSVTQATPAMTLSANPGASSAVLVAIVQNAGPPVPTGAVQFSEAGNLLGGPVSLAIASPGTAPQASLQIPLSLGIHTINASYSGDATYTAANADPVTVTVMVGEPKFSLSGAGGNTSASVQAGQTAIYKIGISSQGFLGTVQLSCTGAPAGSTCIVSPDSANLTTNSTVPITVKVSGTEKARSTPTPFRGTTLFVVTGLCMGLVVNLRRKYKTVLVLPLAIIIAGLAACGGHSGRTLPVVPVKPPTAATLVVTAVSGSQTASINLSLIISH